MTARSCPNCLALDAMQSFGEGMSKCSRCGTTVLLAVKYDGRATAQAEARMTRDPPLVVGGQGKDAASVTNDGKGCLALVAAAVLLFLVGLVMYVLGVPL